MSEKEANRDRVNPATLAARNEREHGPLIDQVLRDYPKLTREVCRLPARFPPVRSTIISTPFALASTTALVAGTNSPWLETPGHKTKRSRFSEAVFV